MKNQLFIKSINSSFFNKPNIHLFISSVFNNFIDLYDYPQLNHNIDSIYNLLMSDSFHGFIVFYKTKIIGYLLGEIVNMNGNNYYFINYLFVSSVFRNKKLGSLMLNYAKKYIMNKHIHGISLIIDTENHKNIQFYKKHGFIISENRLFQRHELFNWYK